MVESPEVLKEHVLEHARLYRSGVLKPELHYRLVEDLQHYAMMAGIQESDIITPFSSVLGTEKERQYLCKFSSVLSPVKIGFRYVGLFDPDVSHRMAIIAGTLLRNFISVRLITAETLVTEVVNGHTPDNTALLIPDFAPTGLKITNMRRQILQTVLFERANVGKKTFIGIANEENVAGGYGVDVLNFILARYTGLQGAL